MAIIKNYIMLLIFYVNFIFQVIYIQILNINGVELYLDLLFIINFVFFILFMMVLCSKLLKYVNFMSDIELVRSFRYSHFCLV